MHHVDESGGAKPTTCRPGTASTDCVPPAERWRWWCELADRELMPTTIRSPYATRFHGSLETFGTPAAQVAAVEVSPLAAVRTPRQIRGGDPENYCLVLVRSGRIRIEQERGTASAGVGEMALFSTSHPLSCEFVDEGGRTAATLLRLPRSGVPLRSGRADRLLGRPLGTHSGAAALLAGYLSGLPHAAWTAGAAEAAKLASVAADLATTAIAVHLDAAAALPPETRDAALRARVHAFIDLHLGDPDLGPTAVAAAHHISVRTLHALFRGEPETVAASIRRRRLQRCHADLTSAAAAHRTVAEIAARWGFRQPGDFSRAYRAAYGRPPREARADAPGGGPRAR